MIWRFVDKVMMEELTCMDHPNNGKLWGSFQSLPRVQSSHSCKVHSSCCLPKSIQKLSWQQEGAVWYSCKFILGNRASLVHKWKHSPESWKKTAQFWRFLWWYDWSRRSCQLPPPLSPPSWTGAAWHKNNIQARCTVSPSIRSATPASHWLPQLPRVGDVWQEHACKRHSKRHQKTNGRNSKVSKALYKVQTMSHP